MSTMMTTTHRWWLTAAWVCIVAVYGCTDEPKPFFPNNVTPPIDCDAVPEEPSSTEELDVGFGHHDVAFDDEGNMYGSNDTGIIKSTKSGEISAFVASMAEVEGMDFLPNGDLVVAHQGGISLVDPDGVVASPPLVGGGGTYGITIGPDGMIYACNHYSVFRIHPSTGDRDELMTADEMGPGKEARVVNFSPDADIMYIATRSAGGEVYAVELNASMNPTGAPYLFASGVGQDWQDALGVDACGNVYVPEYWSYGLYRITPDGDVTLFQQWDNVSYGHGIEWGRGKGGWNEEHIYMPQPYDGHTVVELDIGVPSRSY